MFFKNIKPLFTSQTSFYHLVYHSIIFKPRLDVVEQETFWLREGSRLYKFIRSNEAFYNYYKRGETEWDEIYFVRANADVMPVVSMRYVEAGRTSSTSHDGLIGTLLAMEKYNGFVKEQLKLLTGLI